MDTLRIPLHFNLLLRLYPGSSMKRASGRCVDQRGEKSSVQSVGQQRPKGTRTMPRMRIGKRWGRLVLSLCDAKEKRQWKPSRMTTQTVHVQFAEGPAYLLGRLPRYACRVGKRGNRTSISESKGTRAIVGTAIATSGNRITSHFPTQSGDMCDTGIRL